MVLLVCSCLNIRVHGKGSLPELRDPNSLNLPEIVLNDPFFEGQVYHVTLDLAGVTVSQKVLCKSRSVGNWIITTCTCCIMDVFAKCADDHEIAVVASTSETNTNMISSLMESEKYSLLFKLVLPEIDDNFIQNNIGIEFQNGSIDHSIEHVQNQVSNYLKDEQKAMEERIRRFTEEQQSRYANLLQKVRKNKQAMVYLMVKCKESQNQNSCEPVTESSIGSPLTSNRDSANESSASTDSAFDRSDASDLPAEETTKQQKIRCLKRTLSNPIRPRTKVKHELKSSASIDAGGVFDMEEFDTKESLLSDSEDDIDDSEIDVSTEIVSERLDEPFTCASSLPLSIPAFSRLTHLSPFEDDEKAPEDIAASMRALACSVRDGTEMFGELPRRRLNTGELLAFRPC